MLAPDRRRHRLLRRALRGAYGLLDLYHRKAWFADSFANRDAEAGPTAWHGRADVEGVLRPALALGDGEATCWRLHVPPRAVFRAYVAAHPARWNENAFAVAFLLRVCGPGGRVREQSVELRPGARPQDRGWRLIHMDLSALSGNDVEISLGCRASGVPGIAGLWGSPSVSTPKPWRHVAALLFSQLRAYGLKSTLRKIFLQSTLRHQPESEYQSWIRQNALTPEEKERMLVETAGFARRPVISLLVPVYNVEPRWLHACVESVKRQLYAHWELCLVDDCSTRRETVDALRSWIGTDTRLKIRFRDANGGISAASNDCLAMATGDFVALLDHDDELAPEALFEVARLLDRHPETDMVYTDEDKLELDGTRVDPFFKPEWSPEHFYSFMYTCHLGVYRAALVRELGGFRTGYEGSQDYDLAIRVAEKTRNVRHIAKVLYHWRKISGSTAVVVDAKPWALSASRRALEDHVRRAGLEAQVESALAPGYYRVRHAIRGNPLVTLFIPTDGRVVATPSGGVDLLANAVRSIAAKTDYPNYEILVVDNGRLGAEAQRLLRDVPHRRIGYSYEPPFNFSKKVNFAVPHAKGEHVVIFNDDVEVLSPEWLRALLEHSQNPEVGGVGSKLTYPDGRLQHIGIVFGPAGTAAHVHYGAVGDEPGYYASANVVRNYSAVTGACFMTRRAVFNEVGGFDEALRIDYNDVDFCLRVRERGYRIVYTPYARLMHRESASFGLRVQDPAEVLHFKNRWSHIVDDDPYYSPHLTRDHLDCRIRL